MRAQGWRAAGEVGPPAVKGGGGGGGWGLEMAAVPQAAEQ